MQHDFILLDRSGSMSDKWDDTLGAINAYVRKLADDKVDTGVTLAAFDCGAEGKLSFTILRDRIIPSTWHAVTNKDAHPRGGTPLNDATAEIVRRAEAGNYDKVAIVIMTDGMENSSREYKTADVKAMLDRIRAKNWQVIYIGADFDNWAQAHSYGTAFNQHVSTSTVNAGATMRATASKRATYGITGQSMTYTPEEQEAFKKNTPTA